MTTKDTLRRAAVLGGTRSQRNTLSGRARSAWRAALAGLLLALAATACAASGGSLAVGPSTTVDPLHQVVAQVYAPTPYWADVTAAHVTWRIGTPPAGYDGYTTWSAVLGVVYRIDIVVAVPDPGLVAHEGGHAVCITRWADGSEECAQRIADEVWPPR
jgi:hypothetical protein